jgi:hypothetical protein
VPLLYNGGEVTSLMPADTDTAPPLRVRLRVPARA